MTELVSVLLPFRDAEDTLGDALRSILRQRDCTLEVIAIDDGSRDGSRAIVDAIGDPRVRVLESGGAGLVAALELGRRAARGAWIARMDADDVALPDRLAVQLRALVAAPRVGALGARVELFSDEPIGEGMRRYVAWQNALQTPEEHRRDLFVEAPLCHPSVLLRRAALEDVGGWRAVGWAEDYDLWLRLDAAGWALAKVPEMLLRWRHRAGSATFTSPLYTPEALLRARAAFLAPKLAAQPRPTVFWGAGRTGRRLVRALEPHGARASLWIDVDPAKIGRQARGAPIVSPDALVRNAHTVVVAVGARGARDEVRAHLVARGFVEGDDFVCAA